MAVSCCPPLKMIFSFYILVFCLFYKIFVIMMDNWNLIPNKTSVRFSLQHTITNPHIPLCASESGHSSNQGLVQRLQGNYNELINSHRTESNITKTGIIFYASVCDPLYKYNFMSQYSSPERLLSNDFHFFLPIFTQQMDEKKQFINGHIVLEI